MIPVRSWSPIVPIGLNRLVCGVLCILLLGACTGPSATDPTPPTLQVQAGRDHRTAFTRPEMPEPNEFRTATGAPGPGYWQQRADYAIAATLDAQARALSGRQTVTYTNNSPDVLTHLWFNLDQNLFSPTSDGARMTKSGARFGNRDFFKGGYSTLRASIDGKPVDFAIRDTLGRIDLPAPLPARGGVVRIDIEWAFPIAPYGSDRFGIEDMKDGPIFQLAQWFPNICVYDDVHGWNILPYLGQGEFYTNFGRYEVSLTVPRTHIVAATGVLQNADEVLTPLQRERLSQARASAESVLIRTADEVTDPASRPAGGDTLTWRFIADNVRTFAWASSAAFIWDACATPHSGPGSDGDPARGDGVLCQSFYPREAMHVWGPAARGGGSSQMLRTSIEHYGKMWYAYPYPTASNVNGIVGGMEYPMIVFCGGGRQTPDANGAIPSAADAERALFNVTTHELGHNWFPMLINTDERRHAWMDEGFDTFINYYANLERYPDILPRRGNARVWAREHPTPSSQPLDIPADQVAPGTLGKMQYGKTATGLVLLREGILGAERFDRAFREYIRRWAFKSPRPWDFFRTIEDLAGEDLGWFWRGWFYSTGVLDQAVAEVRQPAANQSTAVAVIDNRGELVMPLSLEVTYDDGRTETRRWPVQVWYSSTRYEAAWDTGGSRIRSVEIDAEQELPDVNLKNNRWER